MDKISIEESLRWMQRFLAREWQLALPIALTFLGLPALVSTLVMTELMTPLPQTMADMQALVAGMPWWLTPFALALTIVMLVGGLALVALALLPQVSVAEAIQTALRRLPATVAVALLLWAATLLVLIVAGVATAALGLPQLLLLLATMVVMVAAGLSLVLLLPLIVDRRQSPIAAMRSSRRFYRGTALRLGVTLILYLAVTFVAALAIQVALGSVVMLVARLAGGVETGRVLVAVFSSVTTALQGAGLFLLTAAFYRQRVGRA